MKDGRWTLVDRLLGAALDREPHERAAFLSGACGDDEELRREVESLLAHERNAGDFLVHPAPGPLGTVPRPARQPLSLDRELGPYRFLKWLGSGGMGDVYLARDTRLKRDVALKILPDSFATNPERLARFQREAEILASLNHPHIAGIHGIEESDGVRALVLEFVEGETLADRISGGPIPVSEALPIARQITDALHAAHEQGVIHRDLKPANVTVTSAGIVKVLDFGLAKAMPGDRGAASLSQVPAMTVDASGDGPVFGTAAYMSPEQARGQSVDKRTDIWAFGCVLYEMLAGHAAFARRTIPDTLASVLGGEPEWNDLPETTPPSIRRLVQRCLDKKLARRLHDIADARIEIEDALESPQTPASFPGGGHKVARPAATVRTWQKAALGLGAVALVVGGLGLMARNVPPPAVVLTGGETVQFAIHLQPGEQFPIDTGLPVMVATSPDGNYIVYAARGAGGDRLYLRRRGDLEPSPIAGTEGAIGPFFSPDGQWIGFASGGMLRAVPVLGGTPRTVAEAPNLIGASWGPRDTIVYGNWSSGLVKVSAQGGPLEALTTPDERQGEYQHSAPHILPDGRAALFTANRRPARQFVELVDFATRQRRSLIEGRNPIYLPSGHIVFARGSTLFAVPFDVSSREVTDPAIRLVDGIRIDANDTHFAMARDGTLVYVPELSLESRLVWYDRKGNSRPLDLQRRRYSHPRISPDGTRVVLNVFRESGEPEIWIYDAARGGHTRLGPTGSRPIWAADGSVTFQMKRSLYSVPADDSGQPELVLEREARFSGLFPLAWSRNGRVLMFSAPAAATNRDVWMLPSDSAITPFLMTPRDERAAMFSPDGRWVVYAVKETGREEQVYVQRYPGSGGRELISPEGGIEPVWSPTGREIFYRSSDGTRIMSVEVDTEPTLTIGDSRVLLAGRFITSEGSYWSNYDVSRDGQEFVLLEGDQASTSQLNVVLTGPIR